MSHRPAPDGVARGNGALHGALHAGTPTPLDGRRIRPGRRAQPGRAQGVQGRPGARLRALGLRRLLALPAGDGEPLRGRGGRPGRSWRRGRPRRRPGRVHGGAVGPVPGADPGSRSRGRRSAHRCRAHLLSRDKALAALAAAGVNGRGHRDRRPRPHGRPAPARSQQRPRRRGGCPGERPAAGAGSGRGRGRAGAGELREEAGGRGAALVLDGVATDDTLALAAGVTSPGGAISYVGRGGGSLPVSTASLAFGCSVHIPTWGTLPELAEVVALARSGPSAPRPSVSRLARRWTPTGGCAAARSGAVPWLRLTLVTVTT